MPAETIDHPHPQICQTEQARAEAVERLHHATAIYTAAPVVDQLIARLDWPREGRRVVGDRAGRVVGSLFFYRSFS